MSGSKGSRRFVIVTGAMLGIVPGCAAQPDTVYVTAQPTSGGTVYVQPAQPTVVQQQPVYVQPAQPAGIGGAVYAQPAQPVARMGGGPVYVQPAQPAGRMGGGIQPTQPARPVYVQPAQPAGRMGYAPPPSRMGGGMRM